MNKQLVYGKCRPPCTLIQFAAVTNAQQFVSKEWPCFALHVDPNSTYTVHEYKDDIWYGELTHPTKWSFAQNNCVTA